VTPDGSESAAFVLAAVFGTHVAAILSPGPNVLLVGQAAAGVSRRAALAVALGLAVGAAAWCTTAVVGVAALSARGGAVAEALRILGAAYLGYLAVRLWRSARGPLALNRVNATWLPDLGAAFRAGLFTNLTNPKALGFYLGVVAAIVPAAAPIWLEAAVIGLVTVNSAAWHAALAGALASERVRAAYAARRRGIDRGAAAVLGCVALAVLVA
jgi:threonine/homoserine/homoserine lactone efflux protein